MPDQQVPTPAPPPQQNWDQISSDPRFQSASPEDQMGMLKMYKDTTSPYALASATQQGIDPEDAQNHINNWYQDQATKIQAPKNFIQAGQNVGKAFNYGILAGVTEQASGLARQAGGVIEETPNTDLAQLSPDALAQEKVKLQDTIKQIAPQLASLQTEAGYGKPTQANETDAAQARSLQQTYEDSRKRLQDVNTALSTGEFPQANETRASLLEGSRTLDAAGQNIEKKYNANANPVSQFAATTGKFLPAMGLGAIGTAVGQPELGLGAMFLANHGQVANDTYNSAVQELTKQNKYSPQQIEDMANYAVTANLPASVLMTFATQFFGGAEPLDKALMNPTFRNFAAQAAKKLGMDVGVGAAIGGGMQESENAAMAQAGIKPFNPTENLGQAVAGGAEMGAGGAVLGGLMKGQDLLNRRQELRDQTNHYADAATVVGQALVSRPDLYPGLKDANEGANHAIDNLGIVPEAFRDSVKQVLVRRAKAAGLNQNAQELAQTGSPQTAQVIAAEAAKVTDAPLPIDNLAKPAVEKTGDVFYDSITQAKAENPGAKPGDIAKRAAEIRAQVSPETSTSPAGEKAQNNEETKVETPAQSEGTTNQVEQTPKPVVQENPPEQLPRHGTVGENEAIPPTGGGENEAIPIVAETPAIDPVTGRVFKTGGRTIGNRVFSKNFQDRVNLTEEQGAAVVDLHEKLTQNPDSELTDDEQRLIDQIADSRILTNAEKENIAAGQKTEIADLVRKVANDVNRYSKAGAKETPAATALKEERANEKENQPTNTEETPVVNAPATTNAGNGTAPNEEGVTKSPNQITLDNGRVVQSETSGAAKGLSVIDRAQDGSYDYHDGTGKVYRGLTLAEAKEIRNKTKSLQEGIEGKYKPDYLEAQNTNQTSYAVPTPKRFRVYEGDLSEGMGRESTTSFDTKEEAVRYAKEMIADEKRKRPNSEYSIGVKDDKTGEIIHNENAGKLTPFASPENYENEEDNLLEPQAPKKPENIVPFTTSSTPKTYADYAKTQDAAGLKAALDRGEKIPITKAEHDDVNNFKFRFKKFGMAFDPESGEGYVTDLTKPPNTGGELNTPARNSGRGEGAPVRDVVALAHSDPAKLKTIFENASPEHVVMLHKALDAWRPGMNARDQQISEATNGMYTGADLIHEAEAKYLEQLQKAPDPSKVNPHTIMQDVFRDAKDKADTVNKKMQKVSLDTTAPGTETGPELHEAVADKLAPSPAEIAMHKEDGTDPEVQKREQIAANFGLMISDFSKTLSKKDQVQFRKFLQDANILEKVGKPGDPTKYERIKQRFADFVRKRRAALEPDNGTTTNSERAGNPTTPEPTANTAGGSASESERGGTAAAPGSGGREAAVNAPGVPKTGEPVERPEIRSPRDRGHNGNAQEHEGTAAPRTAGNESAERTDTPGNTGAPPARGVEPGASPDHIVTGTPGTRESPSWKESTSNDPRLRDYRGARNLKEAARIAAEKVTNPAAKILARKIAELVPEGSKLNFYDPAEPITIGDRTFDSSGSAGFYHDESDQALVNDTTTDPDHAVLHEAVHAALDSFLNADDDVLTDKERDAREAFMDTYKDARVEYKKALKHPDWMTYATSSPEEFAAGVISDPRVQKWLGGNDVVHALSRMFGGPDNPSIYDKAMKSLMNVDRQPPVDYNGASIHAANPFTQIQNWGRNNKGLSTAGMILKKWAGTTRAALESFGEPGKELSGKADRYFNDLRAFRGRAAQVVAGIMRDIDAQQGPLEIAGRKVLGIASDRVARFSQSMEAMQKAIDEKQPPPAHVDPLVTKWYPQFKLYNDEIGDWARSVGLKTQLPDGTWRDFNPNTNWDGVLRNLDRQKMSALSDPFRPGTSGTSLQDLTPKALALYNEGLNARTLDPKTKQMVPYWNNLDEMLKWRGELTPGVSQDAYHSGLERARTRPIPSIFYDYGPEATYQRMMRDGETRARVENFGQNGVPGVKDAFDQFLDKLPDTMTNYQRQLAKANADLLRNEIYRKNTQGDLANVTALARTVTSALQTGNPYTAGKVGISRAFYTVENTGVMNSAKALYHVLTHLQGTTDSARMLGVLGDMQHIEGEGVLGENEFYNKMMAGSRLFMEAGMHGVVNRFANTVNLQAEKNWLAGAISSYQHDPTSAFSRFTAEKVARRGMGLDLADLAKESMTPGPTPLTEAYLRKAVTDTQTSYQIMDQPGWSKTPVGKLIFQYNPWSFNATRMLYKENLGPALDAFKRGDYKLGGLYLSRLAYWGTAGVAGSEALNVFQHLFGRDTMQSAMGDFLARLDKYQDGGKAMAVIGHRIIDDLVTGSFLGMAGDQVRKYIYDPMFHQHEVAHAWNPFDPTDSLAPVRSIVGTFYDTTAKLAKQGFLSHEDMDRAAGNLVSGFREGQALSYAIPGLNNVVPGYSEAIGRRERNFARSKLDEFFAANPGLDHRDLTSTQDTNYSPQRAYRDNILDAIYAGNATQAKQAFDDMVKGTGLKRAEALKDFKASLTNQAPIPTNQTGLKQFGKWAKTNLSDGELQRIHDSQEKYIRTATAAGFLKPADTGKYMLGYSAKGKKLAPPVLLNDL